MLIFNTIKCHPMLLLLPINFQVLESLSMTVKRLENERNTQAEMITSLQSKLMQSSHLGSSFPNNAIIQWFATYMYMCTCTVTKWYFLSHLLFPLIFSFSSGSETQ